jgi:glycosyltransferase 2 family protein
VKPRLVHLLRLGATLVVVVCLWLLVRKIDWTRLGQELAHARVWPLVVAAVLNYVLLVGKAVCWRIMLAPRYHVSTARLVRYTIVAFAASVLAPARAGELLRVWLLKKRDGVPVAEVAAVAIAEKLLDGVSMLVLVAPLPWLLPHLEPWVTDSLLICAAIAVVAFVGLFIAVGRIRHPSSWFARFIAGMHVLRSAPRLIGSFAALLVVWLTDLVMIWLVAYAVGLELPLAAGLLILFTLNLAITAPSTPAGVGALEVGVLAATRLLGIADEPAFALALLYHALQILPLVVVGLVLEWRLVLGRDVHDLTADGELAAPARRGHAE